MERDDRAAEDKTATERPAKDKDRDEQPEEKGGPRGNPRVDEETLRKQQEEARRRENQEDS
jgi:hypothetical protein